SGGCPGFSTVPIMATLSPCIKSRKLPGPIDENFQLYKRTSCTLWLKYRTGYRIGTAAKSPPAMVTGVTACSFTATAAPSVAGGLAATISERASSDTRQAQHFA